MPCQAAVTALPVAVRSARDLAVGAGVDWALAAVPFSSPPGDVAAGEYEFVVTRGGRMRVRIGAARQRGCLLPGARRPDLAMSVAVASAAWNARAGRALMYQLLSVSEAGVATID